MSHKKGERVGKETGRKMRGETSRGLKAAGFTLIEIMLVMAVAGAIAVLDMKRRAADAEDAAARAAGVQMKEMAQAVNGYLVSKYAPLVSLTDPNCPATGPDRCVLAPQALIDEGLLPVGYSLRNVWNAQYSIEVRVVGTAPTQNLLGIVLTTTPWTTDVEGGGDPKLGSLGRAVREIGPDGGVATSPTEISGFSGSWTAGTAEHSGLNRTGQLAARVGYNSAMMTVFLRRDGTLPMTGNLNMGGHDIEVAGAGTFASTVTTGDLDVTGTAEVVGDATFRSGVRTEGNLTVVGHSTLSSADVLAQINAQTARVTGNLTVGGSAAVTGDVSAREVTASADVTALGALRGSEAHVTGDVNAGDVFYTGIGQRASTLAARQVLKETWQGSDGSTVPKPVCPDGGEPTIAVAASNVYSGGYWSWENGQPYSATQVVARATDIGASWRLDVRTWGVNASGNWVGVAAGDASATTYCKYDF